MKFKTLAFVALLATTGATSAMAGGSIKDEPAPAASDRTYTANFGVTSDYIFRGFSQSSGDPAVQGGVDMTYKWFYVGAWASSINFGRDGQRRIASSEVDLYAGIKPVVGRFTFGLGVIYYMYPGAFDHGAAATNELDYVELKAGVSAETWKDATFGVTAFYSPDYTNNQGAVWTLESTFAQVLPKIRDITPTFSTTLGYQMGDATRYVALTGNGSDDYMYWNVGLNLGFGDRFSIDMRYWDTDISNSGGFCTGQVFQCNSRFVVGAKVTF